MSFKAINQIKQLWAESQYYKPHKQESLWKSDKEDKGKTVYIKLVTVRTTIMWSAANSVGGNVLQVMLVM